MFGALVPERWDGVEDRPGILLAKKRLMRSREEAEVRCVEPVDLNNLDIKIEA
jgi:hypothetical protein